MSDRLARASGVRALAAAAATAALFLAAARWIGQAPAPAVWGGAVWVFLLATIVALPLAAAGRRDAGRGERARRRAWETSTMVLAVAVWACTLPVVFLLVAPLLGLRAALLTAVALLGVMTAVCCAVCMSSASRTRIEERQP